MASTSGPVAASVNGDNFEHLHRQLLADPKLQFHFEHAQPPPTPPDWLQAIARLFELIAPFMAYIFWAGVIAVAGLIAYAILSEIMRRLPGRAPSAPKPIDLPAPEFHPAANRARALLEEADRLAREGRFDEAARIILHRSIEDMEQAFPSVIAPSMTSREISGLEYLSEKGRATFTGIAQAVERSLFGGRALSAAQFAECREAYVSFVSGAPAQ